ncbi:hypothetical protein ACP4OV_011911 [Aristida adscensionis]
MDNVLHDTTEIPLDDLPWNLLEEMTNGFSEDKKIGIGGYGVVYKGVHPNGQEIAIKKLHPLPALDGKEFHNELQNLTRLRHPNIVRLVGKCDEQQDRCVEHNGKMIVAQMVNRAICLEYMHNGSLEKHLSGTTLNLTTVFQLLRRIPNPDESSGLTWYERYEIIKGTCEGLKYLHGQGIFHLDLKPANILLDKKLMPKIADFGLARLYTGSHRSHTTNNLIGTMGYMPPEFIQKGKISEKFDVFSLGVIIIKIVAGQDGYSKHSDMSSQDFIDLVHGNWRNRFKLEGWESSSHMVAYFQQVKICTWLALSCVEADRQKRPCIGDITQLLNGTEIPNDVSYNHIEVLKSSADDDGAKHTKDKPAAAAAMQQCWACRCTALSSIRSLSLSFSCGTTGGGDLSNLRYPWTPVVFRKAGSDVLNLAKCNLLRVLDLENSCQLTEDHLKDICDLSLLRYLGLGGGINKVPSKIMKLQLLETLNMRTTKEIVLVPADVILLPMLKHLHGRFELSDDSKIDEILATSVKSNLETLAGIIVSSKPGLSQLMHLMTKLRKVKIWFYSDAGDKNLTALSKAIEKFNRVVKDNPRSSHHSLSIHFQKCTGIFIQFGEFPRFVDSVVTGRGGLGSVKLCGSGMPLSKILNFAISSDILKGITELCLLSTTLRWDDLVCLGNLEMLKYLKLEADIIEGAIIINRDHFRGLLRIRLVVTESLGQINIQAEALGQLQSLRLIFQGLDGGSANQIRHLKKLEEVAIHSGVNQQTRASWTTAVEEHPKRPNLLFV